MAVKSVLKITAYIAAFLISVVIVLVLVVDANMFALLVRSVLSILKGIRYRRKQNHLKKSLMKS